MKKKPKRVEEFRRVTEAIVIADPTGVGFSDRFIQLKIPSRSLYLAFVAGQGAVLHFSFSPIGLNGKPIEGLGNASGSVYAVYRLPVSIGGSWVRFREPFTKVYFHAEATPGVAKTYLVLASSDFVGAFSG